MGEVHFGSAETIDGWRAPFPVLGVAAALTDELANPAPITDQLERNQSGLSPESTDGEMNLASAELMETTDLKVCPLVGSASDTAEDYLHQVTGNIPAQATGSVGTSACGNIPGQSTGSLEAQETRSPGTQTAEKSEVATIASSRFRFSTAEPRRFLVISIDEIRQRDRDKCILMKSSARDQPHYHTSTKSGNLQKLKFVVDRANRHLSTKRIYTSATCQRFTEL